VQRELRAVCVAEAGVVAMACLAERGPVPARPSAVASERRVEAGAKPRRVAVDAAVCRAAGAVVGDVRRFAVHGWRCVCAEPSRTTFEQGAEDG
jgi:hypothetical protein